VKEWKPMSTLHNTQGFCIPFAGDDQIIEAGFDDPDYGEPEGWPSWTDERWEPTDDDEAWWVAQNDDEDWSADASEQARWSRRLEELHQASEWQDRLEAMNYVDGDQAAADAGLPVG
jgi:hypothetical protein